MAKLLVFQYDCGWEHAIKMLPQQTKNDLVRRLGPRVQRIHRRQCDTCRKPR